MESKNQNLEDNNIETQENNIQKFSDNFEKNKQEQVLENFDKQNRIDFDNNNSNKNPKLDLNQNTDKNEELSRENINNSFSLPTTLEDYFILSKNFYAGFWIRFIAYVIDLIVVTSITSLINVLTFNKLNIDLNFPIIGKNMLSVIIVMFIYFILMTYFFSQTMGKIIMKIKVEPNKCGKLTFSEVMYREVVGRLLNIGLFYLPYLFVFGSSKKKGLHDYIADTVVVKEDFSKLRSQMNKKIENISANKK